MSAHLASIAIRGFRSIADVDLQLSSEVTLLIGANGSGKSNVVDAIELLGRTVDQQLQASVTRNGGFDSMLHRTIAGTTAESIEIEAWGPWAEHETYEKLRNGYEMSLSAGQDDSALLTESTYMHGASFSEPARYPRGQGRESTLPKAASEHYANKVILDALSGCRVFHFDDTSIDAPPLKRTPTSNGRSLLDDARNIAAVLLEARDFHREAYDRIVRSVRTVAPFFRDFVLDPQGETVALRWQEFGMDDTFPGSALSSGTLRFICLATLLLQPSPPATIVLDEPELGLHPAAVRQLAGLLRTAGAGRRIIAATQSVTLLGNFSIDEVAVVERVDGGTTVERPSRERLEAWLSDYSLGELWEMNLLGGQPRARAAKHRTWS